MEMTTPVSLPFLSEEPCVGEPPRQLEDFRARKLRKFPHPPSSLQWEYFLGAGEDGFVISAKIGDTMVAVKFFYDTEQPPPIDGLDILWSLERECVNASLLSMIKASVQHATDSKQPIYLNPEPKTWHDAIRNLEAFAADSAPGESNRPDGWTPADLGVQINDCLGWPAMPRADLYDLVHYSKRKKEYLLLAEIDRAYMNLEENESETRFAIVYSLVPEQELDEATVQRQMDFFYLAGFEVLLFNQDNWRGEGVLVDLCDLVSPYDGLWWDTYVYVRMSVAQDFETLREIENRLRESAH